ncbi:hypothetical protein N7509_009962 [Penicillium cosmopolitanum]|uniref:BZIP domain-containing protein n=1 Tax=Penicillium cosmopolitanum TaxID=1131564 RepID=A0A9W9VQF4_9EURO|nr:uncharacterized protein N7509_009962 [Penicillium cosmopolitanum]KAJ5387421.1 hypothetical protein N7509_009962 [Penicillium cosmopolitanum]
MASASSNMRHSRRSTMVSANVPSTERTSKRTTNVPVSEHRRTQLRLAQQAYRYRKETVTQSLKNQVERLQTQIQNLRRTFQAYNHEIERSGVLSFDSTLEGNLQQLRKHFLAICAAARPGKEDGSAFETNEIVSTMTLARKQGEHSQQIEDDLESATSRLVNGGLHLAHPRSSFNRADREENNPRGKTLAQNYSSLPTPALETVNHSEPVPYAVDDSALNIPCPSHLFYSSTSPFRETSFERRLHRACLNNGYHLLVDPTTDPDNVNRVFRLPLTLSTRDSIIQQVKGLLEGGLDEAPEMWEMPFFLLGGAGTHYPRRDHTGRPILPPNALPVSKFISAFVHETTAPQPFHSDHDLLADLGLDGEWLDSYDVEGYLKEKGIFLSADTTFCRVPARAFSMELRPSDTVGANALHVMEMDESTQGHMYPHNVDLLELQSRGWRSEIQI